jgi:hypothetical protein
MAVCAWAGADITLAGDMVAATIAADIQVERFERQWNS